MALLETPSANTGFIAPNFTLKNIDGRMVSLDEAKGEKGTVIAFICNHCPYVKAVIDRFVDTATILESHGIKTIAIMPNDTDTYPEDSFDKMADFARANGFAFPYLIDETQEIAQSYGAICTPDIFGFDADLTLQYRGRIDSSGKNPTTDQTVPELINAMQEIARTGSYSGSQFPSIGCSIKWRKEAA